MRNFLLLLLAAFVLGGYIYWVEIKGEREKQEEKVWSERLFPVKKENITKIAIGDTIVLERQKMIIGSSSSRFKTRQNLHPSIVFLKQLTALK